MTAKELYDEGYRLFWVELRTQVPVLSKPDEIAFLDTAIVQRWATDQDTWETSSRRLRWNEVDSDVRRRLPFSDDFTENPPTIGEMLDEGPT